MQLTIFDEDTTSCHVQSAARSALLGGTSPSLQILREQGSSFSRRCVVAIETLQRYAVQRQARTSAPAHLDIEQEADLLAPGGDVPRAAAQLFDAEEAAAILRGYWRDLARRAADLALRGTPPDPGKPKAHPLWLFAQGEDWDEAARWMLDAPWSAPEVIAGTAMEVLLALGGIERLWPSLCRWVWLAPEDAHAWLQRQRVEPLTWIDDFDALDFPDARWYPAWCACQFHTYAIWALTAAAGVPQDHPWEIAMAAIDALWRHDTPQARGAVGTLHPALLKAYLWVREKASIESRPQPAYLRHVQV